MGLAYDLLKLLKVLGVAALFAGSIGAVLPKSLEDRRVSAYFVAGPAFGTTWFAGFMLAMMQGISVDTWWVITAIVLSLFSIQVVLFSVGVEGRRSRKTAALIVTPLVGCVAVMILRGRG